MKKKRIIPILFLILIFSIFPIPHVRAAWLSGWSNRKSHTITGSTGGAQSDYQVGIKVYYGAGADGTEVVDGFTFGKVYMDSKCRTDFGDIRFTKADGTSLLDYWIEYKINSNYALIWVEIDTIPDNPNTVDIYIYYGKADATTTSDGDATFIFFDDFENQNFNKWTSSGNWQIVSNRVKQGSYSAYCSGDAADRKLIKNILLDYGVLLHVWAQPDVVSAIYPVMGIESGSSNWIYYMVFRGTGTIQYYQGSYVNWPSNSGYSADTWYELELGIKSYGVNGKVKGWKSGAYMGEINNKDDSGSWVTSLSDIRLLSGSGSGRNLWIDVVSLRKYVDPEPTHTAWGSEESSSSIENIKIEASDTTPNDEQWFFLNVSVECLMDTSLYQFTRIDIDPLGLNLSCSYTNSTDTFAEENDPNNFLQLDPIISVKTDENITNLRLDFYIRIHFNVTKDGAYNVGVFSSKSDGKNDSDTFSSVFTLTMRTPSMPTELFGAGFNSSSPYVELHWSHDLLIYDFYEVENSTDLISWTYLGQNTTTQYTDTLVSNATDRYYKVRACRNTGVGWKNSTFTPWNFETVYFVMGAIAGPSGGSGIGFMMLILICTPIIILLVWRTRKR